jgi:hypothetical protein
MKTRFAILVNFRAKSGKEARLKGRMAVRNPENPVQSANPPHPVW